MGKIKEFRPKDSEKITDPPPLKWSDLNYVF